MNDLCARPGKSAVAMARAVCLTLFTSLATSPVRAQSVDGALCVGAEWYALGTLPERHERDCRLAADLPASVALRVDGRPAASGPAAVGPAWVEGRMNSAWPYLQHGRGAWAGRGTTWRAGAAAEARFGPLRVRVQPEWFHAQNRSFDLAPVPGGDANRNKQYPNRVDAPQRFGVDAYARLMPGQSTVEVRWSAIRTGVTTATEVWGAAVAYPALMGTSAEGLPRAFLELREVGAGPVGSLTMRAWVGQATASAFSPDQAKGQRMVHALVGMWRSPGRGDVQVGAGRIVHQRWPDEGAGWPDLRRPFDGLFGDYTSNTGAENGLMSVFARAQLPGSGFEIYGEWARDDWWLDINDLVGEPIHTGTTVLGVARAWPLGARGVRSVRVERISTRQAQDDPSRGRPALGVHSPLFDGHTNRGMLLGSPATIGGGGLFLRWSEWRADRAWSVHVRREEQVEEHSDNYLLGVAAQEGKSEDVLYGLGVEASHSWAATRVWGGAESQLNLNRHFESDAWNVILHVGVSRVWF